AAATEVPAALVKQLAIGGRLVVPVGEYVQEIILIEKVGQHDVREQRYPGFQFVPLITEVE
ncbi:MAG: protein-L-isoaspartate O-methyltransferase, partial [Candidatus Kerfeldbacteria bacterium]|nr:protein-L-isoaspartate O-methyltransferase [Candidatus Kerfeldbacteria bacterium]